MHIALLRLLPLMLGFGVTHAALPTAPQGSTLAQAPAASATINGIYCQSASAIMEINEFFVAQSTPDLEAAFLQYNSEHGNSCAEGRLSGISSLEFEQLFVRSDGMQLAVISFQYAGAQLFTAMQLKVDRSADTPDIGT